MSRVKEQQETVETIPDIQAVSSTSSVLNYWDVIPNTLARRPINKEVEENKGFELPIEVWEFFDVHMLDPEKTKRVYMDYKGVKYSATITRSPKDITPPHICLCWSDEFNSRLTLISKENDNSRIIFRKSHIRDRYKVYIFSNSNDIKQEQNRTSEKEVQQIKEEPGKGNQENKIVSSPYKFSVPINDTTTWHHLYGHTVDYVCSTELNIPIKNYDIKDRRYFSHLQQEILSIVDLESPISQELIIHRVNALHHSRRTKTGDENIQLALKLATNQGRIKRKKDGDIEHYFSKKNHDIIPRRRNISENLSFENICPDEIRAMILCILLNDSQKYTLPKLSQMVVIKLGYNYDDVPPSNITKIWDIISTMVNEDILTLESNLYLIINRCYSQ